MSEHSTALCYTPCQAVNTFEVGRQTAAFLTDRGLPVLFDERKSWQDRYKELAWGDQDMAWICSWPAAEMLAQDDSSIELLTAPVMRSSYYANKPVYFSYMIVREEAPYQQLSDLQNTVLAVNEPKSHSGSRIVHYWLAKNDVSTRFFRHVHLTGGHLNSIEAIRKREADCAAIDSTLFDWLAVHQPGRLSEVRSVARLRPSPGPPLVINKRLPLQVRQRVRKLLLNMHRHPTGQKILQRGLIARFAPPEAFDTQKMWEMAKIINEIEW